MGRQRAPATPHRQAGKGRAGHGGLPGGSARPRQPLTSPRWRARSLNRRPKADWRLHLLQGLVKQKQLEAAVQTRAQTRRGGTSATVAQTQPAARPAGRASNGERVCGGDGAAVGGDGAAQAGPAGRWTSCSAFLAPAHCGRWEHGPRFWEG
ncbi:hypothetical protein P154DRAFT_579737 [Amniculicola lignicola CBS 123094]|uniref:Uncharacterized protein n=1 Tax=Amniculicola lignicola CBS 123094 TaxID=1392246 RepID=A0A6A5W473_9PLEO|nr:hypothetical protein P154DRAFT_579737 [Amniculicola lignicola CBS 123094]